MKCQAQTEAEMRDAECPWPKTKDELMEFIDSLLDREHDYGTCVYAMSLAATAAFYYAWHVVGSTGFQAGCAEWDFLRRTGPLRGPAMLLDGGRLLYPQYDIPKEVAEWVEKSLPWAAEEARKLLQECDGKGACSAVLEHWRKLAAQATEAPEVAE